jgi:hypothetical protein
MHDDGSHRHHAGGDARGPRSKRTDADQPRWRRALRWLLGAHEDVDQEGLLAERTLAVVSARRRQAEHEPRDDPHAGPPR